MNTTETTPIRHNAQPAEPPAGVEIIFRYFPGLTERQRRQFEMLGTLYPEWNAKVNVISRKDIANLYEHHVLHSLAIARLFTPESGTTIVDLGTGGGFPGIPLAILWPDVRFHLIDRIGKKINVARSIAEAIGLGNVTFRHGDAGECHDRFDYVVSRAVTDLDKLVPMARKLISPRQHNKLPNGLICLKGGDLEAEISRSDIPRRNSDVLEQPVNEWFAEPFFETKKLVYKPF